MFPTPTDLARRPGTWTVRHSCCRHAQTMLQKSIHGIVIIDGSHSIRFANPAAERILGLSAQITNLSFPFSQRRGKPQEIKFKRQDGRDLVLDAWGVETEWEGKPALLVSFQDITARNKTEQELKKMSRAVMECPVVVVIAGADGTIEFVNPKYSETTGYSFQEAIGRSLFDGRNIEAPLHILDDIRKTVNSGREWRGEATSYRKSGERFHQALSIAPVQDANGVVINLVAVITDVTERKHYEEQLRNSERQLSEAQKIAHLGSWKRYLDTGKSFWSDELFRIFGLEPGAINPSLDLFLSMVHPEDRERVRALAREALQRKEPFSSYYCRIVRPDGSLRVLLGQGEVILDETGTPVMMIGTALDVTERMLLENEIERLNASLEARAVELESANRELESFSYTVCHDLRSPLTNIQGYCQVLDELCSDRLDAECRKYLREISLGTERMNHLIDTLLNFSLVTSRDLNLEEVDLSTLAQDVASDLRLAEPERQVEFSICPELHVTCDGSLLRIVLQNLLGNAWKFTCGKEHPLIEFGIVEKNGERIIFVRDNGIGFSGEEEKTLFAPFQRLPGTTHIKGHGIGLATVKRIIERHGGTIWAEGEPGRGATFFFTVTARSSASESKRQRESG